MDPKREPGIKIDQIFLVESHFSHRPDFLAHPPSTEIQLGIKVEMRTFGDAESRIAGVTVKVMTDPHDEAALYQFAVEIGALVSAVKGEANLPPHEYVTQAGASFLYPFLREYVANLTARGRFGAIYLKPFNVRRALNEEGKILAEPPARARPKRKSTKRVRPHEG